MNSQKEFFLTLFGCRILAIFLFSHCFPGYGIGIAIINQLYRPHAFHLSPSYAFINELSQFFVPNRFPSLGDLIMNLLGVALSSYLYFYLTPRILKPARKSNIFQCILSFEKRWMGMMKRKTKDGAKEVFVFSVKLS